MAKREERGEVLDLEAAVADEDALREEGQYGDSWWCGLGWHTSL